MLWVDFRIRCGGQTTWWIRLSQEFVLGKYIWHLVNFRFLEYRKRKKINIGQKLWTKQYYNTVSDRDVIFASLSRSLIRKSIALNSIFVYFVKQLPSDEGFHVNSIQNVLQVEKCLRQCHGYDAYNYIMMAIFQFHFTCGKPASKTCGKTLIQKRSWPFKKLIINSLKFWVTKSRQVRLLPKEYTILSDDVWCSYFENE